VSEQTNPMDSFANHVLADWDAAMDTFFNAVDRKRRARDLTGAQVREALNRGYDDVVSDAWDEWYGEGDSYEEDPQ
jgi:hypothetical protein